MPMVFSSSSSRRGVRGTAAVAAAVIVVSLAAVGPTVASTASERFSIDFREPVVSDVGVELDRSAVGDLDGDGDLDLVVADFEKRQVELLRGDEDGRFEHVGTADAGLQVEGVMVADLNGDPFADVIVTGFESRQFAVLTGRPGFDLDPPEHYPLRGKVFVPTPADLDGDDDLDLVVAQKPLDMRMQFMENDGDATFSARSELSWFSVDQVVDVDLDGVLDLIGRRLSGRVVIVPGLGDFAYGEPTRVWMGRADREPPADVAAADLNGDGVTDLVTISRSGGTIKSRLGQGDGTYGPLQRDVAGGDPVDLTPIDLDLDGRPDLVVYDEAKITVLRGRGDGSFRPPVIVADGVGFPRRLHIGDVNHDDRSDLIVVQYGSLDLVSTLINASSRHRM